MSVLAELLPAIISCMVALAKGIWGMDKPQQTEVVNDPGTVRPDDDTKLLGDLGLRVKRGAAGKNEVHTRKRRRPYGRPGEPESPGAPTQ